MLDVVLSIVGPLLTYAVLTGLDCVGARRFNPSQKWHATTSWYLPTFLIWSTPLSALLGAVLATIGTWGERPALWSAISAAGCALLAVLTAWAFRYRFFRYTGKGAPRVENARDWKSNPDVARKRYELGRRTRWAPWVLGITMLPVLALAASAGTLNDPNLIIAVAILTGIMVYRWVTMRRLKDHLKRIDPPPKSHP